MVVESWTTRFLLQPGNTVASLFLVERKPMPSKSPKQHRFMEAVAHGAKPKSGSGPSQQQAKEFVQADAKAGQYQGQGGRPGHKPGKGKR